MNPTTFHPDAYLPPVGHLFAPGLSETNQVLLV
jgi:hypothetical protein